MQVTLRETWTEYRDAPLWIFHLPQQILQNSSHLAKILDTKRLLECRYARRLDLQYCQALGVEPD
jgi:hypothetical protein